MDVYIQMLTDDNARTTAQLFLGGDLDRRRLLRLEVAAEHYSTEGVKRVVEALAKMDFFDGIMLKKDLPLVASEHGRFLYSVIGKEGKTLIRGFSGQNEVVAGFPIMHEEIGSPNTMGYIINRKLKEHPLLRDAVTNVQAGSVWFFRDEETKRRALEQLLGG